MPWGPSCVVTVVLSVSHRGTLAVCLCPVWVGRRAMRHCIDSHSKSQTPAACASSPGTLGPRVTPSTAETVSKQVHCHTAQPPTPLFHWFLLFLYKWRGFFRSVVAKLRQDNFLTYNEEDSEWYKSFQAGNILRDQTHHRRVQLEANSSCDKT